MIRIPMLREFSWCYFVVKRERIYVDYLHMYVKMEDLYKEVFRYVKDWLVTDLIWI